MTEVSIKAKPVAPKPGAARIEAMPARRCVVLASRHEWIASEVSGLLILRLFRSNGTALCEYQLTPDEAAEDFQYGADAALREARRIFHRPAYARRG